MDQWARQRAQAEFLGTQPSYANLQRNRQYRGDSDIIDAIKSDDIETLRVELVQPKNFGEFVNQAYTNPEGWAIRVNPVTGDKEMMVAGSKSAGDWALNVVDTILFGADKVLDKVVEGVELAVTEGEYHKDPHISALGKLDLARRRYTKKLERIARENGVDIIYGHSRGGAIAADMKSNAKKVGIDAAMLIANNTSVLNLSEAGRLRGAFDAIIGLTGEDNEHIDLGHKMHKIWT